MRLQKANFYMKHTNGKRFVVEFRPITTEDGQKAIEGFVRLLGDDEDDQQND